MPETRITFLLFVTIQRIGKKAERYGILFTITSHLYCLCLEPVSSLYSSLFRQFFVVVVAATSSWLSCRTTCAIINSLLFVFSSILCSTPVHILYDLSLGRRESRRCTPWRCRPRNICERRRLAGRSFGRWKTVPLAGVDWLRRSWLQDQSDQLFDTDHRSRLQA